MLAVLAVTQVVAEILVDLLDSLDSLPLAKDDSGPVTNRQLFVLAFGTRPEPFGFTPMGVNSISPATPMGVNSISPAHPHVLRAHMGRTCR